MDPSTTLFTFMLQTHPSVRSVQLVGSWDNFSRTYAMERDSRRDRGQWRGTHSFKDIICDGDNAKSNGRDGGLKMGQTYYYYYELDGFKEIHDPAQPSTSSCPYLPGQQVNTVSVPTEKSPRKRSASASSLRREDFKTMNPTDKFVSPRAAPTPPDATRRLGTSTVILRHQRSARSLSPASNWPWSPRKLFGRKTSSPLPGEERGRAEEVDEYRLDQRSVASSEGPRSREISPESLRRFLSDDSIPTPDNLDACDLQPIFIPEDIAEEIEDDDNFATSAASDSVPFTILSPPPTQRTASRNSTLEAEGADLDSFPMPPTRTPPRIPTALHIPQPTPVIDYQKSWFSPDSVPTSPVSPDTPSFDHSEGEEDESNEDESVIQEAAAAAARSRRDAFASNLAASLSTYSLPRSSGADKLLADIPAAPFTNLNNSPALLSRDGTDVPSGNAPLLAAAAADSTVGDLMSELGWMAAAIHGKHI